MEAIVVGLLIGGTVALVFMVVDGYADSRYYKRVDKLRRKQVAERSTRF